MEKVSHEQTYQQMRKMPNEKQWRQYLAIEAKQRGRASQVAREAGVSLNTVKRGKELIGSFKNNGREWQAKGEDTGVNAYDFLSLADGKAVPYGVYDLVHN